MTVSNRRIPRLSNHRAAMPHPQHFQHPAGFAASGSVGGNGVGAIAGNADDVIHGGSAILNGDDDGQISLGIPFPKHVPFPNVEHNSELLNEFLIFGFTIIASATQFLHLYRTVWWLPNSYTRQAVNFYLIDWDLSIFIYVMASRRLLYCCILKLIDLNCPESYVEISKKISKYVFLASVLISFVGCGIQIFQKNSYLYLFCLSYPFVLYLTIFGFNLEQFLRTIVDTEVNCINGMPIHSCSSNAVAIRTEIDALKTDFNNRFKQIIFTSLLNAYYSGFVPCVLVPKHLYFDIFWATQHLSFIFIGGLTMCVAYCFPVKYCDVFHRAALHLGQWNRVTHRTHHPPPYAWSKSTIFPYGTYVKHMGEIYRASGYCTAAVPGNNSHFRFFVIFKNPALIYMILFAIQVVLIVIQLLILCMSREWHNLISIGFLLLANYFTLFKIARDYMIAKRIYAGENAVNEKFKSQ
ncbi:transmembrane protein 39A-B [Toxorhynchites rutilus septentrionalis]|uniref:transmembrane protein 39A-B n=1 Tax=Toxorhynchites rutilus septentrionalis TaxID=329112 RepID=UPI002479693B|nr:transmembrane protein 39A-B [Toxorhynchites rutilus septentrionalis]XP_055630920.1 transmembrane protein 39A-B [Toxorhynchites rutilus septentrionalis]